MHAWPFLQQMHKGCLHMPHPHLNPHKNVIRMRADRVLEADDSSYHHVFRAAEAKDRPVSSEPIPIA